MWTERVCYTRQFRGVMPWLPTARQIGHTHILWTYGSIGQGLVKYWMWPMAQDGETTRACRETSPAGTPYLGQHRGPSHPCMLR